MKMDWKYLLLDKCIQLLRSIDLDMCNILERERDVEELEVIVRGSHDEQSNSNSILLENREG